MDKPSYNESRIKHGDEPGLEEPALSSLGPKGIIGDVVLGGISRVVDGFKKADQRRKKGYGIYKNSKNAVGGRSQLSGGEEVDW